MRRLPPLVVLLVAFLVSVPSVRAHASAARPQPVVTKLHALAQHPTLRQGDSGAAVSEMQELLDTWITSTPHTGLSILPTSGYFGGATQQVVVTFQQAHGLPAAGLVGPRTWAILDEYAGRGTSSPASSDPVISDPPPAPVQDEVQVFTNVSDQYPSQYTEVTVYGALVVNGQPVSGAPMAATWYYKSGARYCYSQSDDTGNANCTRYISGATIGYTVRVDITFSYNGYDYTASTAFTPQ